MIKRLQINNFRNYSNVKLAGLDSKNIVVLYGENGEGKTNILEAISLLSENSGLRKSRYEDIINKSSETASWSVMVDIDTSTFCSAYVNGRRVYQANDKSQRGTAEFLKENYVLWMTYETDRLFMQSPSDRRDFIDMLCSVDSTTHLKNVRDYEKLTRERLKILKRYCETGFTADVCRWLDIIESKIVALGLEIALTRISLTRTLQNSQIKDQEFPEFSSEMRGGLEELITSTETSKLPEIYASELELRRKKDGFSGSTTFGPNRSDWHVFHNGKQIYAELCSAGEQKMLLSGVFLSFVIKNINQDERRLILLLDDVIAHLDNVHRKLLFEYIKSLALKNPKKISIWLSGVDKNLFDELWDDALFFHVSNATVISDEAD